MSLDINFEILVVLTVCLFINALYVASKDYRTKLTFGLASALSWFAFGLAFIIAEPELLAFSFLFLGLGLIFTLLTIQDVWTGKKEKIWGFG